MIYIRCPSCGYILGNRQIMFEKGLEQINSDPNTDEETKMNLKTNLVESLKLKNYCCKMRVITFKSLPEILK